MTPSICFGELVNLLIDLLNRKNRLDIFLNHISLCCSNLTCLVRYDGGMNWRRVIDIVSLGGLAGAATSATFILVHEILTRDSSLDLWEFGVTLSVPALIAVVISIVTKTRFIILLPITYLTFFIPTLGAVFGSSGSEPFWQFAMLGLLGGLVWSIPFALWVGRLAR